MMRIRSFLSKNYWIIIAIISFLIGTTIRFYYGLTTDLWGDEAISYFISRDLNWVELFFSKGNYGDLMHPPLYYVFLKIVLMINDADWCLRLSSLIWFFPSIYLVYKISSFFKNSKTVYLAISLFSLHPLLINLAFQVRSYSLLIFFILLIIYVICLNFFQPKFSKTILIGLLLSICFFTNYGAIWLILSIFFWAIYLIFKREKVHGENLLLSILVFFVLSIYQIFILLNFLLTKSTGNVIAHSVPYFNFNWLIYQLKLLFGNDFIGFFLAIFFVINLINLKSNKSLINQFLFFSSMFTIALAIIISIFLFPVFLARQLVLFSLFLVFVFAQFHQKLRYELIMLTTLFIFAFNSLNQYNFLFRENIEITVKQRIPSNSIILLIDDFDSIRYYLAINKNNSLVYEIERNDVENQNLENELLAKSSRNVFFINSSSFLTNELKSKETLENNICQKHHCEDIEL